MESSAYAVETKATDTVGFGSVSEINKSIQFTILANNVKAILTTQQVQNWGVNNQFHLICGGKAIFNTQITDAQGPQDLFTADTIINGTYSDCAGGEGEGEATESPFKYTLVHDGKEIKIEHSENFVGVGKNVTLTAKDKDTEAPVSVAWSIKNEAGEAVEAVIPNGATATFSLNIPGKYTVSATADSGSGYGYAENATVYFFKVTIEKIAFNYNPDSATEDGLNIRENLNTKISVPEFDKDIRNKPAAYIKDKAVKILVHLKVEPSTISSLKIKGLSDDENGSLGDAVEKTVTFDEGVSVEGDDNPDTWGFNESLYVEFSINGNTPDKIFRSEDAWKWIVPEINGNAVHNSTEELKYLRA